MDGTPSSGEGDKDVAKIPSLANIKGRKGRKFTEVRNDFCTLGAMIGRENSVPFPFEKFEKVSPSSSAIFYNSSV